MRIRDSDIPKTAFSTPLGHFEYLVLPMGVANGPSAFQAMMDHIFEPQKNTFLTLYLDDILIFSNTHAEHIAHLRMVFDLLRKHQFHCRQTKCSFEQPELKYLGHIVGSGVLRMDPAKVAVIKDWPTPTSIKELRSFLGLSNYFRRFIQGYSSLVAPLTSLVSSSFAWTPAHQLSFEQVKEALISAPVLQLPDHTQPFDLVCDASINGVGAILIQNNHPIAFFSRKFTSTERNYSTGEQELYAVYLALKEFRCYLEGPKINLITDHCPLTYLKSQPHLSRKQARWLEFFACFDYTWQYRPGRSNVADPLSRHPVFFTALVAEGEDLPSPPTFLQEILQAYDTDISFSDADFLRKYQLSKNGEGVYEKTLYPDQPPCVAVPNIPSLRTRIIAAHHDDILSGHQGCARTLDLTQRHFWWPSMHADVQTFVNTCITCQRNKSRFGPTPGRLAPLPIPVAPWDDVSADFCCGLLKTARGFDTILVFIDRFTKMVHIVPSTITCTAPQFAQLFFEHVVQHHGVPKTLLTDRGPQFMGFFLRAFSRLLGCRSNLTTAYRPSTNGQVERINRVIEEILRGFVSSVPDD